jgi:predicted DCC family thiol-disulfide oxidoreductase YuxK
MEKIIIYDGDCNLCRSVVRFIRKRDKRMIFTLVPQQSTEGQEFIKQFSIPEKDTNSVIYITRDSYLLRSSAVLYILKDLGGGWRLLFVFIVLPAFLRDGVYRLMAGMRKHLSSER